MDTLIGPAVQQIGFSRASVMDAHVKRRLTVATCWAMARASALDTLQCFEESFGLTEEFREWILCLDQHPELLEDSVMLLPSIATLEQLKRQALQHPHDRNNDDLLEI